MNGDQAGDEAAAKAKLAIKPSPILGENPANADNAFHPISYFSTFISPAQAFNS